MKISIQWCKHVAVSEGLVLLLVLLGASVSTLAARDNKDSLSAINENNTPPQDTTVASGQARVIPPPLTGQERWDSYIHDTFTSGPIYYASFGAALGGQASNSPKEWERNWGGYGKREGPCTPLLPSRTRSIKRDRPHCTNEGRYVPCQCSGGWHRAGYAIEMTFLTYYNGHKVLDVPQFLGAYGSGMIPVLWYPKG